MPRKTIKKSNQPSTQRKPTNIPPSINTEIPEQKLNILQHRLTYKQLTFAQEYLSNGRNATKAGLKAKYSKKGIHATVHTLLKNSKVSAYIQYYEGQLEKEFDISLKRIQQETAKLAFQNSQDLYDKETGNLIPIHKMDRDTAASIAGIKHTDIKVGKGEDRKTIGHTTEIKTSDKIAALKFLASFHDNAPAKKHKHEVSGPDGKPIETESVVKIFIPENTREKE